MKLGKKLLGLGAAAIIAACGGKNVPKEYRYRINVIGNISTAQELYCKSYSVESDTLTLVDCYPGDYTTVISGQKWNVKSR